VPSTACRPIRRQGKTTRIHIAGGSVLAVIWQCQAVLNPSHYSSDFRAFFLGFLILVIRRFWLLKIGKTTTLSLSDYSGVRSRHPNGSLCRRDYPIAWPARCDGRKFRNTFPHCLPIQTANAPQLPRNCAQNSNDQLAYGIMVWRLPARSAKMYALQNARTSVLSGVSARMTREHWRTKCRRRPRQARNAFVVVNKDTPWPVNGV